MSAGSLGRQSPAPPSSPASPASPATSGSDHQFEDFLFSGPMYDTEAAEDLLLWPEDFPLDYMSGFMAAEGLIEPHWGGEQEMHWGEGHESFYGDETRHFEEVEEEEEIYRDSSDQGSRAELGKRKGKSRPSVADNRRKSLFVHSSPTNFPDVNRARRSAFGSIFLRTTAHVAEDAALLKTVADSSYNMLQNLLQTFEKILSTSSLDPDRRKFTVEIKESLLRTLENYGISRSFSDGSVHWNIYPVTHNYLFSFQIGDRLHQTRHLSRIEERILTGPIQRPKLPFSWPTGSVWTGTWDELGMAGPGLYNMPHGVSYQGKIKNGMFHDDNATLTYPNQFRALHCVYEYGKLKSCQFQFPDMLMHRNDNWDYCKFPDRRFWNEVRYGLKPAKIAQKTECDPSRNIPFGCYDTSDGFFDPVSLMLVSPNGKLLRVPVCEEINWIRRYCRKGFFEHSNFRPDLFENWFNYDKELIRSLMKKQEDYQTGRITYDELQNFYANAGLLPSFSKYKKRKTSSEMAMEEKLKSIPSLKTLTRSETSQKYKDYKIPSRLLATVDDPNDTCLSMSAHQMSKTFVREPSRTFREQKTTSKIGFRASRPHLIESYQQQDDWSSYDSSAGDEVRTIPEPFLKHQTILRPPFYSGTSLKPPSRSEGLKPCPPKKSTSGSSTSSENPFPEGDDEAMLAYWEKKDLERYMKTLIMEKVTDILLKERERHRQRMRWAVRPPAKSSPREGTRAELMTKILGELFASIPGTDEYCDSDPLKAWNLRQFAEDKYECLKYWGNRIFTLDFPEESS